MAGAAVDLLRQDRPRRIAYAVVALILLVLCFEPRHYLAKVKLLPQEDSGAGLSAVLAQVGGGGLQNFAALMGSHQTVELLTTVGRSNEVATNVISRLHLAGTSEFGDADHAKIVLSRKVDVHSLTGGVLEIQAKDADPRLAYQLVSTYASEIQSRVAALTLEQSAKKKEVVSERFRDAVSGLAQAQAALDEFRKANGLAAPAQQFGAAVGLATSLQAELQAKQVALQATEQFKTAQNVEVQGLEASIASLQAQLAKAQSNSGGVNSGSLTAIAAKQSEYLNLFRDERFEDALVAIYTRSLEQASVEELTAKANSSIQVVEAPYIDPHRQYNIGAIGALLAVLLLAFYTEYYVPATNLGRRTRRDAVK
jgi:hypothetical protein